MSGLALVLALASGVQPAPAPPRTAVAQVGPRVEVAFVLDTTGSMGGLIEGAKRRIWSIARRIGEGRPRPDLRIALVAYRDLGDAYVTRVFDLTGDMDDVYANLMSFQAAGGGDTPEHVSAALHDAVHKLSWSKGQAMEVIFLVGDAPPHVDYQDGFDYRRHTREARARGLAIETIECGDDPQTAVVWQQIAAMADGHFARIDAAGGMQLAVTPVDGDLARLNSELQATIVAYGSLRERAEAERKLAARAAMPTAVAAEAAGYYAGSGRLAEKDLVDMPIAEQKKELQAAKSAPGGAPQALAGKSDEEALAYLQSQKLKRSALEVRIATLQKQRDDHLAKAGNGDGFDETVVANLRQKAAALGIRY